MTQASRNEPDCAREEKLPRRDWVLLPLICVLTILIFSGSVELIARHEFVGSESALAKCFVLTDPTTGVRGVPNCVVREKTAEGPWVEERFNSQGYRAGLELGPKQPGTFRIVMVGSSTAMGEHVAREATIAARLPLELTRLTGHPVELYNEGLWIGFSHNTDLRFKDALAAHPDMVLWMITQGDVFGGAATVPTAAEIAQMNQHGFVAKAMGRIKSTFASKSLAEGISDIFGRTRTAVLLRVLLYQSQTQYVKSFLAGGDDHQGYLKAELSEAWKKRLRQVDSDAADMGAKAKAAGVPLVAYYSPDRAQAAMISTNEWPQGYDPYKLDRELRAIVTSHGGTFLEILPDFRNIPNPEQYYYSVDGHPNASGHAEITHLLSNALTHGAVPALNVAGPQEPGLGGKE